MLGAFLGFLLTRTGGNLVIKDDKYVLQAMVVEFIATFLFVLLFIIQHDERTRFSSDSALNCFFISVAYGSCVMLAKPISGGCINPAVCVGINITNFLDGFSGSAIKWIWLYGLLPLAGSIIAILFYEFLYKRILIDSLDTLSMEEDYYDRKGSDD